MNNINPESTAPDKESDRSREVGFNEMRGCLIGGAVGDALGAPVEFNSWPEIRSQYGEGGVTDLGVSYGVYGAITDDTQMTLFTAEGMIRGVMRFMDRGLCNPVAVVQRAYIRWLHTQGEETRHRRYHPQNPHYPHHSQHQLDDGWLITNEALWNRRAPGDTCITALRSSAGLTANNDSKGCGAVMRVAPIGLVARDPFGLAQECSELTHGHPTGQIAGGAFAYLISRLARGRELKMAVVDTLEKTRQKELENGFAAETSTAILRALQAWERRVRPTALTIEHLGEGWVAEEALAISIYCALSAETFADGVLSAVNHSGDSDSTGAMTGNILGLIHGYKGIPAHWRETVELADVISTVASDLTMGTAKRENYPPY